MSGKSRPRKERHNFPLTGVIKCGECRMMITAESHTKHYKNGESQTFIYYRCTKRGEKKCNQPYLPAPKLEKQVISFLKTIKISDSFVNWAVKWLNKANDEHTKAKRDQLKALQKNHSDVRKRLDNLLELKISPNNVDGGLLSDEEFQEQKSKLLAEKVRIAKQLKMGDKQADEWIDLTAKTFNFAAKAQERFEKGPPEEKKTILKAVGSNLFIKDRKLTIQPRKPFLLIKEALLKFQDTDKMFEPEKYPNNMAESDEVGHQFLTWGG